MLKYSKFNSNFLLDFERSEQAVGFTMMFIRFFSVHKLSTKKNVRDDLVMHYVPVANGI